MSDQGGLGASQEVQNQAPTEPADPIQDWHDSAKARFDKVKEAQGHLQSLRTELDSLIKLGDFVEPDDVVKSAATLVGKGFHPQELATILSDMPMESGEILQQWILTHDRQVAALEAQVEPVLSGVRHQLATSALHVLMRNHLQQGAQAAPADASGLGMTPPAGSA